VAVEHRVEALSDRRLASDDRDSDTQPIGLAGSGVREGDLGLGWPCSIAGHRPADRVVEHGNVEDAAAKAAEHCASVPVVGERCERDPAALRLKSE
jgi:hypothetical protein